MHNRKIRQDIQNPTGAIEKRFETAPHKNLSFELLYCFSCSDQAGKGLGEVPKNIPKNTNTQCLRQNGSKTKINPHPIVP